MTNEAKELKQSIDATVTLYDIIAPKIDIVTLGYLKAMMKQCFLIGQIVGKVETRSLMRLLNEEGENGREGYTH